MRTAVSSAVHVIRDDRRPVAASTLRCVLPRSIFSYRCSDVGIPSEHCVPAAVCRHDTQRRKHQQKLSFMHRDLNGVEVRSVRCVGGAKVMEKRQTKWAAHHCSHCSDLSSGRGQIDGQASDTRSHLWQRFEYLFIAYVSWYWFAFRKQHRQ